MKLNPDNFVKDELEFEGMLRGEVPTIGVLDLRKQSRSLVRRWRPWLGCSKMSST